MQGFDKIILILYGAITVFFIYRLFKQAKDKKLLGVIAQSFKKLKKWGFDTNRGELVMAIKKDKNTTRETVKVRKEDIAEINDLIRKYKLGK